MIDNLIKAATCRVSCGDETGTGHLITDCKILTARHCVLESIESESPIELTFINSEGEISFPAIVVAQSEKLDACILSVPELLECSPLALNAAIPREGGEWRSFGYPIGKTAIGHRIFGTISHLLETPKLKMDIDLTIDPSIALQDCRGLSGAAVICENTIIGMIRLKLTGTLGAISIRSLESFLMDNGIQISQQYDAEASSIEIRGSFAERYLFQNKFEQRITDTLGGYIFIEGVPGIGKTTFCREFKPESQEILTMGTYSLAIQGRGPGVIYRAQPEVFFDWLSTTVSTLVTGKPSRKSECSYADIIRETSTLLDAFSDYCNLTQRHGILFLDGLNEALTAAPDALSKLIGLLPQSLPNKITIVLTSPNYNSIAGPLSGRVKRQNVLSLPPLNDEACSAYCWQELEQHKVNPALVRGICEKAQGHPLYLRYLIEYANSSCEEEALNDFPVLTGSIEQYYELLWPRLLDDENAINLLAIIARLRWGIGTSDFLKVLTSEEQMGFTSTISRIRHLLLNSDTTTIYHPSFADFLLSKTADLETFIQNRLGKFCINEPHLEYSTLNIVFHLLRSGDVGCSQAVIACNQNWVDKCVAMGVEPDALLFDIESTVSITANSGPAVEVIRLLLLSQRVSFRYNTLFAQSARLIAEALIALDRPQEALKHAIRFNTLIVDPDEALQIAFILIQQEHLSEASELLELLHKSIIECYPSGKTELESFFDICSLHIRTLLFMRLADGGGGRRRRMHQINHVIYHTSQEFRSVLSEDPELLDKYLVELYCLPTSYFLCFHDVYASLKQLHEATGQVPQKHLLYVVRALIECKDSLERYNIPNELVSLSQVFSDIEELIMAGEALDNQLLPVVIDALIALGAPLSLVQLVAGTGEKIAPQPLKIRAENGVDVDFRSIHQTAFEWRIVSFLDNSLDCPIVGVFDESGWLMSLENLFCALFFCEGKARRAKADNDEEHQLQAFELLRTRVLQPLSFTLAERVKWCDSCAIPENTFPLIYERVTSLLIDCYPKELPIFLKTLSGRALDQCGLYSEGFRETMIVVFQKLTMREIESSIVESVFELLQQWKEHVIRGVENRHELVPELLKLIPIYVKVGAHEEAERLYKYMLSVSMGPTWYKEDQLGLMVETLRNMPLSDDVQSKLPQVAGYLERASGEMTFQRYVRFEKSLLIGEMFRRVKLVSACRYFKRQTCGTTGELLSESQYGAIDKPSPMVGMRFPGGALDEQHAILQMVRNTDGVDWRLRWALLEIFQCGDERHIDDYATEYAKLINQNNIDSVVIAEMVVRMEFVFWTEIEPEKRNQFIESFRNKLDTTHHNLFSKIMPQATAVDFKDKGNAPVDDAVDKAHTSQDTNSLHEDSLYLPGVFGHQAALRKSDEVLADAERDLKLRNLKAIKCHAIRALKVLQSGGWSIWGDLSGNSKRAEALLREGAESAEEIIRSYAPLLYAEKHEAPWRVAEHLIPEIADLLSEDERSLLLKYVIDHVNLMVGDATNEIEMFRFLSEEPSSASSEELFTFVLWLLDHPQFLRRDKAAGMIAWLVESDSVHLEQAVKEAFSMATGYSAEILCGVLDSMSMRHPGYLWDQVFEFFDFEKILQNCRHVGRLAVLHRIAERAGSAGSSTGAKVASRVVEQFRSGMIEFGNSGTIAELPQWASCISKEWKNLFRLGVLPKELIVSFEEELSQICAPLSIKDAQNLENSVSYTFRTPITFPLNRWEAKVRFALNTALFPYASRHNFSKIEQVLRVFNPNQPEHTLMPGFISPANAVFNAIYTEKDYAGAIADAEYFFLNYHETMERSEVNSFVYLEVVAVIVPSTLKRQGFFIPSINTSFTSRESPDFDSINTSHETCYRIDPELAYLGTFTPAFPLPAFTELIQADEDAFLRVNWRNGRASDIHFIGRPMQEGCLLAIKRTAVCLPDGMKLAWILRVNGEIVTMIDSNNNKLV